MERIIEVVGLKKAYGNVKAVNGIDFYVKRGELFAFLGPNGAGKSTTIEMLSTQLTPDTGDVLIDGHKLGQENEAIRKKIGIVFQDGVLDALLTVKENLMLRGSLYPMTNAQLRQAVSAAARTADVMDFWNRPYGKLSGGQRRRADIARALVHTPQILFLDEPTTGLDPQTRHNVWNTIRLLQKEHGMTIFLTTHYMEEAAQADSITIMDHGQILAQGTPAELKEHYSRDLLRIRAKEENRLRELLAQEHIVFRVTGGEFVIDLRHTMDALVILDRFREEIAGFEVRRGTMDDVFLNLTGAKVRD